MEKGRKMKKNLFILVPFLIMFICGCEKTYPSSVPAATEFMQNVVDGYVDDNASYEWIPYEEETVTENVVQVPMRFSYTDYEKIDEAVRDNLDSFFVKHVEEDSAKDIYDEEGFYNDEFMQKMYEETYEYVMSLDTYLTYQEESAVFTYDKKQDSWSTDKKVKLDVKSPVDREAILDEYLSNNEIYRKHYSIPKGDEAPVPDAACYGSFTQAEADKVFEIVEKARFYGLLEEDEKIAYTSDVPFYEDSVINYYLDETILMIEWRELRDGSIVTFAEVKIKDPSQFQRKLAGAEYGDGGMEYLHVMAEETNAVMAINADFYAFRAEGTTCYDGTVYRTNAALDTLFVDENGDFQFLYRQNGMTKEEIQQYVDDNNLQFSVTFGPVMIENGELVDFGAYPIGEVYLRYSRAGIGQMGSLHYLYSNVCHGAEHTCTLPVFANYMYEKGVINAYNLDGGQTGEIVINGEIINHIDFGEERTVSDMMFFATALPEE